MCHSFGLYDYYLTLKAFYLSPCENGCTLNYYDMCEQMKHLIMYKWTIKNPGDSVFFAASKIIFRDSE